MPSIKSLARAVRNNFRSAQKGLLASRLQRLTAQSGLGDSAYLLYALVKSSKPTVVVEIGSARGRSTCFMAMALKENGSGKLYAIDPHTQTDWNDAESVNTFEILKSNVASLGLEGFVEICRNTSIEVARSWKSSIDILFIDGDHSYEGAKRDWELFSPFVKPFGSVVFHDTLWDLKPDPKYARPDMGVPRLVDELREQGYPVITLDQDFGVSMVQPIRNGVRLRPGRESSFGSAETAVG
ncbi:MAG: class I SAM-dependent methyltransferase [Pyrinomonadaceae bacterium]|nr:class I SAM-dependent methyltransferase [Pyrinomonadaceae bacterium]